MTGTKPILREFVNWLENVYGHPERAADSEFGLEPPPEPLAMAEVALEAAIGRQLPVLLATSGSVKAVIAGVVLRRAGVRLEQVFEGNLSDDHFRALADALQTVSMSKLMIEAPG